VVKNLLIAALLVVATFFLFYGGPNNLPPLRSVKAFWDLGHVAYFALLTYLFNHWPALNKKTVLWRWLVSLLLVAAAGFVIEVLQYGTHRTPDAGDISRDLVGCLLVLAFYSRTMLGLSNRLKITIQFLVSVIFLLHLLPLSIALFDEAMARSRFPVLSDFETAVELERWSGEASIERVQLDSASTSHQLKILLSSAMYSGTGLQYLPSDWSAYGHVNLRFFQPMPEMLRLTIRIHDDKHNNQYADRFNRSYNLEQGWSVVSIPLVEVRQALASRQMDLTRIRDISFFTIRLSQPRILYLDSIYLSD
jgi:hypothetical protein